MLFSIYFVSIFCTLELFVFQRRLYILILGLFCAPIQRSRPVFCQGHQRSSAPSISTLALRAPADLNQHYSSPDDPPPFPIRIAYIRSVDDSKTVFTASANMCFVFLHVRHVRLNFSFTIKDFPSSSLSRNTQFFIYKYIQKYSMICQNKSISSSSIEVKSRKAMSCIFTNGFEVMLRSFPEYQQNIMFISFLV